MCNQARKCVFANCNNEAETDGECSSCAECGNEFWRLVCKETACNKACAICDGEFHHYLPDFNGEGSAVTVCKHCDIELPSDVMDVFEKAAFL
jgi:hypothetical protein